MPINRKQIALVHVAKTKLGLTDPEYRAVLVHLAGVESSKALDREGFETVLGYFEWKGFAPSGVARTMASGRGWRALPSLN